MDETTNTAGGEEQPAIEPKPEKKGPSLVTRMIIAVIAGFVVGMGFLMFKTNVGEDSGIWQTIYQLLFVDISSEEGLSGIGLFYDVQKLFLAGLQLGIVPLVLCTLSMAVFNVDDMTKLGRVAGKSIGLFAGSYIIAATIAVIVAWFSKLSGVFNVQLPTSGVAEQAATDPYNPLTIIIDIVPNNVTGTFSDNNAILSTIFIAVVLGLIMSHMRVRSRPVVSFLHSLKYIVEAYLDFVISKLAPFSIFCMIVRAFSVYGLEYLLPTGAYLAIGCVTGLAVYLIVYPTAVAIATGKSPLPFLKKTLQLALITAATTSSSAGFPANSKAAGELGCPEDISSFVLPTGMVVHMPGTVVMQTLAVTFIACSAGIDVQPIQLVIAASVAIITAVATPTVPMAGTVMIYVALSAVGFTNDMCMLAYALVVAINYPVGMACITSNTVGDAAVNVIVSKLEGVFDEEKYVS